jgi:hypothetical protein
VLQIELVKTVATGGAGDMNAQDGWATLSRLSLQTEPLAQRWGIARRI